MEISIDARLIPGIVLVVLSAIHLFAGSFFLQLGVRKEKTAGEGRGCGVILGGIGCIIATVVYFSMGMNFVYEAVQATYGI